MNKKGQFWIFPVFMIFIMVLFGGIVLWAESGVDCNYHSSSKLTSVNGVKDTDTGFLAGGTVRERNLMFENGLMAPLKSKDFNIELQVGKEYRIKKCTNNGGRLWYEIS